MAIIVTRGLADLVSVFNQQSIEFTVPNGTANVQVTIPSGGVNYIFTPTRISTVTVDTYMLDLTGILRYVLGFPDGTILSASLTISISATGQTTVTTIGRLCFGYDQIGESNISDYVEIYGAKMPIYHAGVISFYSYTAGAKSGVMNGHTEMFTLAVGFNTITLPTQWLVNGTLEFSATNIRLTLVYRAGVTNLIKWINEEGRLSWCNFRMISNGTETKKSNSIPKYYATHALTTEKSIDASCEKNKLIVLDVIAVDAIHYELLTKIQDSMYVELTGVRMKVKSSDSVTASEKQNLHFTITLEQEQYVATY